MPFSELAVLYDVTALATPLIQDAALADHNMQNDQLPREFRDAIGQRSTEKSGPLSRGSSGCSKSGCSTIRSQVYECEHCVSHYHVTDRLRGQDQQQHRHQRSTSTTTIYLALWSNPVYAPIRACRVMHDASTLVGAMMFLPYMWQRSEKVFEANDLLHQAVNVLHLRLVEESFAIYDFTTFNTCTQCEVYRQQKSITIRSRSITPS